MVKQQKIDEESIKHAKRSRIVLIVVIILIILAIAAVIGAFFYLQKPAVQEAKPDTTDTAINVTKDSTDTPQTKVSVPALSSYYGLTPDAVVDAYGKGAAVSGTSPITDEANPLITQLSTVQLSDEDGGSAGTLYLSLTAEGTVIDIYYGVPLSALGNNETEFSEVLADSGFLTGVLADAGIASPGNDFVVPAASEYQTLAADGKTVAKESYRYSGATSLDTPANWELTLTFDHSTAASSATAVSANRMLYLRLY